MQVRLKKNILVGALTHKLHDVVMTATLMVWNVLLQKQPSLLQWPCRPLCLLRRHARTWSSTSPKSTARVCSSTGPRAPAACRTWPRRWLTGQRSTGSTRRTTRGRRSSWRCRGWAASVNCRLTVFTARFPTQSLKGPVVQIFMDQHLRKPWRPARVVFGLLVEDGVEHGARLSLLYVYSYTGKMF